MSARMVLGWFIGLVVAAIVTQLFPPPDFAVGVLAGLVFPLTGLYIAAATE